MDIRSLPSCQPTCKLNNLNIQNLPQKLQIQKKNKGCKTGAEEEMAKSFSKKNTCSVLQKLFNPLP
jgi:hypothetical protein